MLSFLKKILNGTSRRRATVDGWNQGCGGLAATEEDEA
jgi:hypothetical protein